jgi:hypothetical protein
VRPPRKSWKQIGHLSGGEKTLSSLALVFALHHYKPTPLYVMDEIDAALDFKNVSIVGNYIKERTRNAQFIVISLRNNMFELADRLVGAPERGPARVAAEPAAGRAHSSRACLCRCGRLRVVLSRHIQDRELHEERGDQPGEHVLRARAPGARDRPAAVRAARCGLGEPRAVCLGKRGCSHLAPPPLRAA